MSNGKILAIYGAGGLGREVLELAMQINEESPRWKDFVFVDDGDVSKTVNGIPVFSYDAALERFGDSLEFAIGVGEPSIRSMLFAKVKQGGHVTPALVHPGVHIPESTTVGEGAIIQYGCFVSCNVVIGDRVFIQPQCNIGHDDVLEPGCMVSGLSNLGGAVRIGEESYVGLGTAIREGVDIGDHSIVGMMSAVHKDVPAEVVAMGNPARPMAWNDNHRVFKTSG